MYQTTKYNSLYRTEKQSLTQGLGIEFVTFKELCETSDVIIICCALTNDTAGIFNKGVFQRMKKTATIINVARGPVINQDDLIEALQVKYKCYK